MVVRPAHIYISSLCLSLFAIRLEFVFTTTYRSSILAPRTVLTLCFVVSVRNLCLYIKPAAPVFRCHGSNTI
ncbi:hypothetical protein ARMSODRAFT_337592 [Armillaria solidipes]|uniref:Uncharacterized protein n=1 Tax=Armillaria solidipes TaxID=1076256 RepID=A0A2H3BJ54_9AGAR|nr:hypothetical protein ARMSODRAFT_337592 [Armillaria solidipes]